MKVFISWSGDRSKSIAEAIYEWLPTIIQQIKPWMSEHDIEKGTRGLPTISQQLEETQFGVICLTPENQNAPWLLFEAGALSKSQDQSRVWTLLYGLEPTDVKGPLSQFQHTKAIKEDIKNLLYTINSALGSPLILESQLEIAFNRGWSELEEKFTLIEGVDLVKNERSEKDMIKEILELTRAIASERRNRNLESDRYVKIMLNTYLKLLSRDPNVSLKDISKDFLFVNNFIDDKSAKDRDYISFVDYKHLFDKNIYREDYNRQLILDFLKNEMLKDSPDVKVKAVNEAEDENETELTNQEKNTETTDKTSDSEK
jgi:hypothetical protein